MRSDLTDPVHRRPPPPRDDPGPLDLVLLDVPIALGAGAPSAIREIVVGARGERLPTALVEDAQLIVSELVASVIRSGAEESERVTVTLRARPDRRAIGPEGVADGGAGMNLVATLSDYRGLLRDGDGPSRVWAALLDADADVADRD
jgi:hypothetical protein